MKYLSMATVAVVGTLFTIASFAADGVPSLVGKWETVTGSVGHWEGGLRHLDKDNGELVVTEQLEGIFRGTMTYETADTSPEHEGTQGVGRSQTEAILGVIDWDGKTIFWVDHDDETVHRARLVNENTMEVIAYEPGDHAVVARTIMIRR